MLAVSSCVRLSMVEAAIRLMWSLTLFVVRFTVVGLVRRPVPVVISGGFPLKIISVTASAPASGAASAPASGAASAPTSVDGVVAGGPSSSRTMLIMFNVRHL